MYYVYLIRSIEYPSEHYVGYTEDLRQRLQTHNQGGSPHTAKFRPWQLETYLAFTTQAKAQAFERYLKTGSGRAFAEKRLW